jgi:hypothetical protein
MGYVDYLIREVKFRGLNKKPNKMLDRLNKGKFMAVRCGDDWVLVYG